jgi:hypothetical protein
LMQRGLLVCKNGSIMRYPGDNKKNSSTLNFAKDDHVANWFCPIL